MLAFAPSPTPFIVLMAFGFLLGAAGHLYKSVPMAAAGIAIVVLATLLLPLLVYAGD